MNKKQAILVMCFSLIIASALLIGCSSLGLLPKEPAAEELQQTILALSTQYTPQMPTDANTPTAVIITPTIPPTPLPSATMPEIVCRETKGDIEFREIIIPDSNQPLAFRVYLPPCYDPEPVIAYPVLYLLHGQSYKDDQWDRLGVDEAADRLIASGDFPPFIIVMPWELKSSEDDKISQFGDLVIDHLIPWVDEEYRTCSLRECRAIGGISRGAAWAMRLGLSHWKLFGAIGAHSFAPFPGDFYNAPYWFRDIPEGQFPRIYLDMGALDYLVTPAGLFEDRLTKYLVPHEWIINPGTHNEEYWSEQVENYLYWYTFPWKKMYFGSEMGFITATPTLEATMKEESE